MPFIYPTAKETAGKVVSHRGGRYDETRKPEKRQLAMHLS